MNWWILTALYACTLMAAEPANQVFPIRSGPVEYRLSSSAGAVRLDYFGPVGGASWRMGSQSVGKPLGQDVFGRVSGQVVAPEELALVSTARESQGPANRLRIVYQHRRLPLRIEAVYTAWGDTGVISRWMKISNTGAASLQVESLPELGWRLPPGDYELTYLWGGWGQEKQVATEPLAPGGRRLSSSRGRSTSIYSPWFSLYNKTLGLRYAGELAYSGNWQFSVERTPGTGRTLLRDTDVLVSLGTQWDFGGALTLEGGASRTLSEVAFTAASGDLDDVTNRLHRWQRQYAFARTPANDPLLVQFNSWYPFPGKMTVREMKDCAEVAAELGADVFVLDSGWYNKKNWSAELGDYQVDRTAYPGGLEELAGYVHEKGMKFGLWVEIENVGLESDMYREHADWLLSYDGKPVIKGVRAMLNFAKPEVRAWAHGVMDRLAHDYKLDWVKIDYNIDIGSEFDPPAPGERKGTVLADHIVHYYAWLDEVRRKHPSLVIENCSSGGLRFDSGIMAHTHTTWLSDEIAPLPSVQLAYGCTTAFTPAVCNHWMVGDKRERNGSLRGGIAEGGAPGWWDFMLRVPMNGQFGISSRVFEWPAGLKQRAAQNIALYKRIRGVIADGDVYHLTPPPANQDPRGWMGLQYVTPDAGKSVLMAYRLGGGEAERRFALRGLKRGATYRVSVDGVKQAAVSAVELSRGWPVKLDAEWRAAVVELEVEE
ncbi:MAG: Alpha-galactosidase Mel36A [Bryobacteraceae bacterium]|nr:Alpha-galactosidase Mel36A [Bryobacteraceae bacterium]